MIKRLTLRNFKSIGEQIYDFTQFDLLVGRNKWIRMPLRTTMGLAACFKKQKRAETQQNRVA